MPASRSLAFAWFSAIVLVFFAVNLLLKVLPAPTVVPELKVAATESDLLIGSSLTFHLLPPNEDFPALLPSDNPTEVLSLPGIRMAETMALLRWAVQHGKGDVVVEINALTLQFAHIAVDGHFPVMTAYMEEQPSLRLRLAHAVKSLLGLPFESPTRRAKWGRSGALAVKSPVDLPPLSYVRQHFRYHAELTNHVATLKAAGRKLIFFWPPVPRLGAGHNIREWTKARAYLLSFCSRYDTPCWLPEQPWPDYLFMDMWGHLAPEGRVQFATLFKTWARQNL